MIALSSVDCMGRWPEQDRWTHAYPTGASGNDPLVPRYSAACDRCVVGVSAVWRPTWNVVKGRTPTLRSPPIECPQSTLCSHLRIAKSGVEVGGKVTRHVQSLDRALPMHAKGERSEAKCALAGGLAEPSAIGRFCTLWPVAVAIMDLRFCCVSWSDAILGDQQQ